MKKTIYVIALLVAALVALPPGAAASQPDSTVVKDPALVKKAQYVTDKARTDLTLSDEEATLLEDAFYFRYVEGERRTEGIDDPAKVSEIKSAVHKEFSRLVYKLLGREKGAEIVAWYYNYSNRKR